MIRTMSIVLLTVYITASVVLSTISVGDIRECSGVYDWTLPVSIFILMAIPAFLGFIIGWDKDL